MWALALAKLVLHTVFNDQYGIFRDELGYLACGERLAFGYVDQPPLVPFLAELSRLVLGDSLRAVRFLPALASSLLVQGALLAREFGAGRFAIVLTAICIASAPQYLSNAGLLGTNSFEPTLWMGCAWFALRAVKRDDPRQWLWFGIVAGIGLEEKYTIALFGAGIVLGLLLTVQRRALADRWFWFGGVAALLIFLPNLWWNYANHWPFLEADAQHPRGRPRRGLAGRRLLPAAGVAGRSAGGADLAHRTWRAAVFAAVRAVSIPGYRVPGVLRGAVHGAWQELLPRAGIPDAVRGRCDRDRARARVGAQKPWRFAWLKAVIALIVLGEWPVSRARRGAGDDRSASCVPAIPCRSSCR